MAKKSKQELIDTALELGIDTDKKTKEILEHEISQVLGNFDNENVNIMENNTAAPYTDNNTSEDDGLIKIKIFADGENTEPVYVALNGESFLIPRDVEVTVPAGVAGILNDAVELHYNQDTGRFVNKLSYAFTVLN